MGVVVSSNEQNRNSIPNYSQTEPISQQSGSRSVAATPRTQFTRVMPAGSNVPRKEGELLKYKNIFSGWAKRYFRLERTYLHYFEHKYDHEPISTITRGEITEVKPSIAFPDKINVFDVTLKNGTIWYCQASSSTEMVEWMKALSTVPIILDAALYETKPMEPFEEIQPSYNPTYSTDNCINRNNTPSPYQDLHNQAHDIAHTGGYSGVCPSSPPPPYSEQDMPMKFPPQYSS